MSFLELPKSNPIVQRAVALNSCAWGEVGFLPGDKYGCKIYARKEGDHIHLIGIHSRTYGCYKEPLAQDIDIVPW